MNDCVIIRGDRNSYGGVLHFTALHSDQIALWEIGVHSFVFWIKYTLSFNDIASENIFGLYFIICK